jgi:hypothetical protein
MITVQRDVYRRPGVLLGPYRGQLALMLAISGRATGLDELIACYPTATPLRPGPPIHSDPHQRCAGRHGDVVIITDGHKIRMPYVIQASGAEVG